MISYFLLVTVIWFSYEAGKHHVPTLNLPYNSGTSGIFGELCTYRHLRIVFVRENEEDPWGRFTGKRVKWPFLNNPPHGAGGGCLWLRFERVKQNWGGMEFPYEYKRMGQCSSSWKGLLQAMVFLGGPNVWGKHVLLRNVRTISVLCSSQCRYGLNGMEFSLGTSRSWYQAAFR